LQTSGPIIIAGLDKPECLWSSIGGNRYGRLNTECQDRFRPDDRWTSTRQEHSDGANHRSSSSPDGSTGSPTRRRAYCRAEGCRTSDRSGVTANRRGTVAANQLRLDRNHLTVNQGEIRQLNLKPGRPFHPPSLLGFHYVPTNGLAALADNHAIHYNGLH
jgi:hypothetical protein